MGDNAGMDINEFLEARIAEDEAAAEEATSGPWEWTAETSEWGDCGPNLETVAKLPPYPDGSASPVTMVIGSWGHDANGISIEDGDKAHIVRHDPARVLAECAAKRAIMAEHGLYDHSTKDYCETCVDWWKSELGEGPPPVAWPCPTLRAVAAVYKDHPDYQQAWAA
jgi:hypothetical protein